MIFGFGLALGISEPSVLEANGKVHPNQTARSDKARSCFWAADPHPAYSSVPRFPGISTDLAQPCASNPWEKAAASPICLKSDLIVAGLWGVMKQMLRSRWHNLPIQV